MSDLMTLVDTLAAMPMPARLAFRLAARDQHRNLHQAAAHVRVSSAVSDHQRRRQLWEGPDRALHTHELAAVMAGFDDREILTGSRGRYTNVPGYSDALDHAYAVRSAELARVTE